MSGRRERWAIAGEILSALQAEAARGPVATVSAVAMRANISHDRLHEYLADLQRQGLVGGGMPPRLTPRGHEFLQQYLAWSETLAAFGFVGRRGPTPDASDSTPRHAARG